MQKLSVVIFGITQKPLWIGTSKKSDDGSLKKEILWTI